MCDYGELAPVLFLCHKINMILEVTSATRSRPRSIKNWFVNVDSAASVTLTMSAQ